MSGWLYPVEVVGQAVPSEYSQQAASLADSYTYGAASQAMSEGQALQAWAELSKEQNYPKIQSVSVSHACPPDFLFSPDGKTCVNRDNVHVALGIQGKWYDSAALPLYLQLNEPKVLSSGSDSQIIDAAMRGLRAMRMTSGNYGWTNVKGQLRAVAQVYLNNYYGSPAFSSYQEGWAPGDTADVDGLAFALEKAIGPYYDSDMANAAKTAQTSNQIINNLIASQHTALATAKGADLSGSLIGGAAIALAALGALAYFYPSPLFAVYRTGSRYLGAAVSKARSLV